MARSYAGTVVQVLSPSLTNELLVTYSRLTLDLGYKPVQDSQGCARADFVGFFPDQSPYVPLVHAFWAGGQLATSVRRARTSTHTMTSCSSPTSSRKSEGHTR